MTPHNQRVMELLEWCRANLCAPDGKRNCLLCGYAPSAPGEKAVFGIFIANEKAQKRIGAPPSKERLILYILCEDCNALPDRNEQVEDKIFATVCVQ
jgi:hypothetical protein